MSLYTGAVSMPVGQLPGCNGIYMLDVPRHYPIDFEVCDTCATPAIRSLGNAFFLDAFDHYHSVVFVYLLLPNSLQFSPPLP